MRTSGNENPKIKARNNSIYGVWFEKADMIEFKISPMGQFTRIKIMKVKNPLIFDTLSGYCGLKFTPRRVDWKGFDFITHLERADERSLKGGTVHLPHATRKTVADVTLLDNEMIKLQFNALEWTEGKRQLYDAGSMVLIRKTEGDQG
ncbi:MAG: hypothetical protein JSS79_15410 [Bacteroidetes bacterium]|nr:hypothetical protein [Bacteroidota bacterium]